MAIDNEITPEQWEEAWKEGSERLKKHVQRFDDVEAFIQQVDIAIRKYFWEQSAYTTYEDFKEYMKGLIKECSDYYGMTDYLAIRAKENRIAEIEETYDEVIYFWIFNPIKARRERIETWMTIEEQRASPRGLVLRFSDAVKKIF